jgi:hypothetical protein
MKKIIKQLFCKHNFIRYYQSIGNQFLHKNIWYYDDWEIDRCSKCGKEKSVNE